MFTISTILVGNLQVLLPTVYDILTIQCSNIIHHPEFIEAKAALIPYSQVILDFWAPFCTVCGNQSLVQHPRPTKEMALFTFSSLSNNFPSHVSLWIRNWIENCPIEIIKDWGLTTYFQWELEQAEALVSSFRS